MSDDSQNEMADAIASLLAGEDTAPLADHRFGELARSAELVHGQQARLARLMAARPEDVQVVARIPGVDVPLDRGFDNPEEALQAAVRAQQIHLLNGLIGLFDVTFELMVAMGAGHVAAERVAAAAGPPPDDGGILKAPGG